MGDYYCDICYKTINRKSETKHVKSKSHSNLNSCVNKKYVVGDAYWGNFEKILHYNVEDNRTKFPVFKTLIECELYGENIKIQSRRTRFHSFDKEGFYYIFRVNKKTKDYIWHHVGIMGKKYFLNRL